MHNVLEPASGLCASAANFMTLINEANSYSVDLTIAGLAVPLDVFKSLLKCADCNFQTQLMHKMSIMLMRIRERYSPRISSFT